MEQSSQHQSLAIVRTEWNANYQEYLMRHHPAGHRHHLHLHLTRHRHPERAHLETAPGKDAGARPLRRRQPKGEPEPLAWVRGKAGGREALVVAREQPEEREVSPALQMATLAPPRLTRYVTGAGNRREDEGEWIVRSQRATMLQQGTLKRKEESQPIDKTETHPTVQIVRMNNGQHHRDTTLGRQP